MKKIIPTLAQSLICFTATGGVMAQQTAVDSGEQDTVVVTAGRVEERARNVTAAMTVIPNDEIRKNQYQDLGGLLRNYGVQIDSYNLNSNLSQIAIRGVRSSALGSDLQGSILLLVDGRRIGTDNISMIPMVNIEQIEIIRGPAAVQYGTSAVGGVVNVITRRGSSDLQAEVEAGVGSWQTYKGQGGIAGREGPVDFSGGVSYLTMDDYDVAGGHRYRNTGLDRKVAYSGNLGLNFGQEQRIGVTFLGLKADDMGSPGYFNNVQPHDYTDRSNHSVDINYTGAHSLSGLSWMGRYFNGKNNYVSNNRYNSAQYYSSDAKYQGSQAQLSYQHQWLTVTGGVDWLNYDTHSRSTDRQNSEYDNIGVFLLNKVGLFDDRLIVSGGVRHDEYTLKTNGQDRDLHRTTPSFGLAWLATDWLTLRSNYGESYRIPDAIGLLGFKGMYSYIGNPNLKPEKGKTIDAGMEINYSALNFGLTYFTTDYRDKIATRYTPSWDSEYYNMEGKVKYRGLESQMSYDFGELADWSFMLRPYINLTYMLERKTAQGAAVPNVSNLDLAYGVHFQAPESGLNIDIRATYYGHQYVQDWNMASPSSGQIVRVGGKTTADLFVSKRLYQWQDSSTLSIKGEIRNVLDTHYELIKDYPQPGRTYYVGFSYRY